MLHNYAFEVQKRQGEAALNFFATSKNKKKEDSRSERNGHIKVPAKQSLKEALSSIGHAWLRKEDNPLKKCSD